MGRHSLYEYKRDGILDALERLSVRGRAPSLREIAKVSDISVATLHSYLTKMQEEGVIEWNPRSHRSIRVTRPRV